MAYSRTGLSGMISFTTGAVLLALLTFSVLSWWQIPAGSFVDWLFGIGIFAWLMVVVTVPWNLYFEAKEVLNEASASQERNIQVNESQLVYARKLAGYALWGALFLHLLSALGLYYLAYANISATGYYGAGAALLLTLLRPSVRAYEYISLRLANIRETVSFPRDDVHTLKNELTELKSNLEQLQALLSTEEPGSWRNLQQQKATELSQQLKELRRNADQDRQYNQEAHERLSKETRHAVAQLNEDGKFIDNIVEIIRFIKKV